jgi:hypothetical protein
MCGAWACPLTLWWVCMSDCREKMGSVGANLAGVVYLFLHWALLIAYIAQVRQASHSGIGPLSSPHTQPDHSFHVCADQLVVSFMNRAVIFWATSCVASRCSSTCPRPCRPSSSPPCWAVHLHSGPRRCDTYIYHTYIVEAQFASREGHDKYSHSHLASDRLVLCALRFWTW